MIFKRARRYLTISFVFWLSMGTYLVLTNAGRWLLSPAPSTSGSERRSFTVRDAGFRYRPRQERNRSAMGQPLEAARCYQDMLEKPFENTVRLTSENADDFVFVTASDAKYFPTNKDAIAIVQRLFPTYTIIFYDLTENKSDARLNETSRMCRVVYRNFNYSKYPEHVRQLNLYAWKPLVILEVLLEYPGVFYIDASIRFHTGNISDALQLAVQNGGIMTFGSSGHPIFPATHWGMYQYLPIAKDRAIKATQREAGCTYIYRTREVYENVIQWWVACALVEECIAPTRDLFCQFQGRDVYAKCHRYDQSALNILLANYYLYDDEVYFYSGNVITVARGSSGKETITVCVPPGQLQNQTHLK